MGLQSDIQAAMVAADELAMGARQQIAAIDDLDQQVAAGNTRLTELVSLGARSLLDLQNLLTRMDGALSQGVSRWEAQTTELENRTSSLQASMVAELDQADQSVEKLLPLVQAALQAVETTVRQSQEQLQSLQSENESLVRQAEEQAALAETQAQAMLGQLQGEKDELQRHSQQLETSWQKLGAEIDGQLQTLVSDFEAAGSAADTALKNALEAFGQAASQCESGVRATLVEVTAEEMGKLATALGQCLTDLQALGQHPRKLSEQDLTTLQNKMVKTKEPLGSMERMHQKARSLELLDF